MKRKITLLSVIILASINMFGANYFWVGGSGSWSDFSSHWATTSGGSAFYTQVPQSTDNVFFDAKSFTTTAQTVTIDQPIVQCANMSWTGVTQTPAFYGDYTNTLKIYGSLTLASAMTFNFAGPISFEATTTGQTITSAGNLINTSITFNGIGGSWTLQDALNTGWIFLNNGTLTTNNQTVNAYAFTSTTNTSRTLNMGSSTFNLSFYGSIWEINATGMTMNAGTSTIKGIATNGGSQDFYGAGFTYNDIFFTGTQTGKINGNSTIHDVSFAADGYIQGNCNFHNVTFSANAFLTSNSTYNSVTINQNGNFSSSNTFNSLTLSPGYNYTLTNGTTQTINSTLTANGNCGALIQIQSSTSGSQATIAKTAGTLTMSYVALKDINATGGATFTANNTNDLGNNTGWTINTLASKNLYWIGNSGNWNDGNHWSTTSGGAPVGCSPTPKDNVFFDANSFSLAGQTVTVNVPTAYANNMTWTGVTNTPTLYGDYTSTLKIYGSLALSAGMIFNFSGNLNFESTSVGQTITTAGTVINTSMIFNGVGGSWSLQDALTCSYWIYLNNGTLNTNNKTVNAYAFNSITSTNRTLNMGSSVFNLSFNGYIWDINPTGLTVNAGTSIINGIGATGGEQDFNGGGFTYNNIFFIGNALGKVLDYNNIHDVTFSFDGFIQGGNFHDVSFAGNAELYNNNNCNNVTLSKNGDFFDNNTFNSLTLTPGYTYTLTDGKTQTINSALTATGNCGALIDIRSSTGGSKANLIKSSGTVAVSYVTLKDINVGGGAAFTANNTIDLSNNSGWLITPLLSKNLYWVGNGGNWNDGNHWSTTSGGAPTGCSPTPLDNVFFDSHSFSLSGQTVTINVPTACSNNMNWTGVTNTPTLYGDFPNTLKIYGSLTLASAMTLNFTGNLVFGATTPGQTITTAGIVINTSLTFDGIGGSWSLQDALNSNYWVYLNNGTLNTNNKTVNVYAFNSTTATNRTLNMGSSVFNLAFNGLIWDINPTGMTINAGTSTINGTGASGGEQDFNGGGFTYNNIFFIGSALGKIVDNNNINDVSFASDGFIQGGNFHDVTFSGNAVLYNDNICNNVTIAKNGDILGSNTFNNLKFTPGYTYTLTAGETQTIIQGGNICAQGTGALPIRIQSSNVGVPSTISKTNGTICWDYVRLSDITAIGGATFNAGLAPTNSQDMGGNTGFAFTGGCTISGCTPCIPVSITTNPINVAICSGNNALFTVAAFGTGLTYQWQVNQGTGFVNLTNSTLYSGVTTNTLSVSSATNGFNNYQYRCAVTGTCSSAVNSIAALLTVNPLPVVTSSVNLLSVTIAATGGTAPYTGTGLFSGLLAGTYSYLVTDAKGCSSSTTATVIGTTIDNIPPTAICKNASVTLSNGTATITSSMINNGSYDNVGITSITVSPTTFTCSNIGANTITLTVKDLAGNVSTCHSTLTVIGSLPTVSISQSLLPGFCQGGALVLNTVASAGVSYLWNSGETTSTKNVTGSGTSSVTVTNSNGCKATANYTTTYNTANLLSSYTVIVKDEADFENYSFVQSGGVGATPSNGEVEVGNHSSITGTGTFATAHSISVNCSSTITNKTYTPAAVTLPVYKSNSYSQSNSGNCHHVCSPYNWGPCTHHCDGTSLNCSHSSKNRCLGNYSTTNLTDSIYSNLTIGDNTTATFTQPVVYIKSLTVGSHATISFAGCTEIKISGTVTLGDYTQFNTSAKGIVVYCDGNVQIGKGCFFTGSIYTKGQLTTNGTSYATTAMKGLFIAQDVESNYTTWNWNTVCSTCNATRSFMIADDNSSTDQNTQTGTNISANVYPNPSSDNFNLEITSDDKTPALIKVYDITGREVFIKNEVEIDSKLSFGNELKAGIYMLTISQGNESKTLRIIKQNN